MIDKPIIGLQMWRATARYTSQQEILVVPARWDAERDRPVGLHSYDREYDHLLDLHFGGEVSDYMSGESVREVSWPYYYGSEPEYRDVHRMAAGRAKRMADFLLKCEKAFAKADARELGDRFAVFAKCVGAEYVWLAKGPTHEHPRTEAGGWVQYKVSEARDVYRLLVLGARQDTRARLLPSETIAA
jgi:hypothetical protein